MNEFRWSSLHFITKLMVFAACLHLAGDTFAAVRDWGKLHFGGVTFFDWVIAVSHSYGYSLIYFGTAATVELLFRIWREFRLIRVTGATVGERPTPVDADLPA
jgi:hypothetical protein